MPYLIVKNASAFKEFAKQVFKAKEMFQHMRDEHTIQLGELMIGECTIMYADTTEKYPPRPAGMFVYVDNADASFSAALKAGAASLAEPTDQSYGRSCGVLDPFGNSWWMTAIK